MKKTIYDPKQDSRFQHPVIDQDEWRERYLPGGETIPFRYLHGYFEGTDVKFSFCFPPADRYEGRFQQYLSPFPGPDEEVASLGHTGLEDRVGFALKCGAYYVETNMGSHSQFGGDRDDKLTWQSSAAAAEYSREKAMEIYDTKQRPYGYVYGGSGGGYKSMACIENTGAWDGAAPFVIGSPVSLPNTITMHVQGQRVLRNAFSKILDALDAGGSGDPYKELNKDEADMLRELTKMGFPPLAWYMEAKGVIDPGALPVLLPAMRGLDPTYFTDFWAKPGYAGADPQSSASKDRIYFRTKVKSVHLTEKTEKRDAEDGQNGVDDSYKKQAVKGDGAYLELETLPLGDNLYLEGLSMIFQTGDAQGAALLMDKMMRFNDSEGGIVTIGECYGMSDLDETLRKVKPGDEILLDNSDYIAAQSYYRHQVPADLSFHAWDQFRNPDGTPKTPQRAPFPVPFTGVGLPQDGDIQGKVINIQALMDESTCPWCADWWRNKIRETKGTDENHRTYFMERCMHGDINAIGNYMVVNYVGALRQALIDLSAWVEKGIEPLNRTAYTLGEDGQIHTEPDVSKRYGIQGIPTLKANGEKCAHVKVGECVRFTVDVEVPEGAGNVTEILFAQQEKELAAKDTESNGVARLMLGEDMWDTSLSFEKDEKGSIHTAHAETVGSYDKPGTYFATVRIATNREGDPSRVFTQVLNLDRARIVVS
uniref:Uncharacterized protein n=1 Tax=uncultured bacterium Contig140 TaxID=1393424 RepID=W0FK39_9BACT|nr:hypothetical protein [uncultured bacterium Contig140]